jgi:hypothetical protein
MCFGDIVASSGRTSRWVWFAAWLVVGAAFASGFLSFAGLFVLPIAILLTILLARTRSSALGLPGLVAGLGLPLLYIAYINREGPGNVCRTSATAHTCTEEWSPWPWLLVGMILLIAGFGIAVVRQRREKSSGWKTA